MSGVIVGVDIGTTSTKSVIFDAKGRAGASHSVGCRPPWHGGLLDPTSSVR